MKATRVHEDDYELTRCPVCRETIIGQLTVEIHLGDIAVNKHADGPRAEVGVTTRMRSLKVEHRCSPTSLAEPDDEEAGRPDWIETTEGEE